MQHIVLRRGDCVEVLRGMDAGSVGAVVCDPPYGLEFMGKTWDRLDGARWEQGGGFSSPGIGARDTVWPSFSATAKHGAANPTCAVCGGRLRGAKKCGCPKPHDHWKATGKRRNPDNEGLPDHLTGGGMASHMNTMQRWHSGWLDECYRVLAPGGMIKAFGGTRTFHRMTRAMREAGFVDLRLEAWTYGSGFPKSLNIAKAMDKAAPATDAARTWEGWGTALKPAWEPVVVGVKP